MDIGDVGLPLEPQLFYHVAHIIADAFDLAVLHFPIMDENAGRAADKGAQAPAFEAEKGEQIVEQNQRRRGD